MLNRLGFDNRFGRVAATYDMSPRGNGYLVPIIAKSDFAFDARAGASAQEVPLAVGIDSSSWVSGALVVRVHSRNSWSGTTPVLRVLVENIMLVPEEPDVLFAASAAVASSGDITGSAPAAPGLLVVPFTAPIGPLLRVRLTYTVAANQAGLNSIALGVDLVGRPA